MKFFVIADTHGKIEEAEAVCRGLKDIDRIIHLGDHVRDGLLLGERLGIPVTAVKGNMDGSYSEEDHEILVTEWGKILLVHGHMQAVKYNLDALMYKAESLECKAVFFGHTHTPCYLEAPGMIVLNPGSPSQPRGSRVGSYGIVETHPGEFKASISYINLDVLKRPEPPAPRKTSSADPGRNGPAEGGSLRDLLNHSDRF